MSKNILFKVLVALCFVGAAVVWALSAANIIEVNLSWVIAIFAFALGALFILKGVIGKNIGTFKKMNILFGALLVIAGIVALVGTFIDEAMFLPIIAIIITAAVLLCILATGGKKWDQADNQNAGYKDYRTRKKEEAERKAREENNDEE